MIQATSGQVSPNRFSSGDQIRLSALIDFYELSGNSKLADVGRSRSIEIKPLQLAPVGPTHHPAVYLGGASDGGEDFDGDVEVPEKADATAAAVCSRGLSELIAEEEEEEEERLLANLQSSGSHCMVWMLKSMVRLALVTSVQWTPPLLPPVRH